MAKKRYRVLIPCQSDTKGKSYEVGDIIEVGDFSSKVIKEWIELDSAVPDSQGPVLELIGD